VHLTYFQSHQPKYKEWTFADASYLAPRRLVNCANLIRTLGDDANDMRHYIQARDPTEKDKNHGLFSNLTESQIQSIQTLINQLSASQLGAFEHLKNSKHPIVLFQGPPGTGKTTLFVALQQRLWKFNHDWITGAVFKPGGQVNTTQRTLVQQNASGALCGASAFKMPIRSSWVASSRTLAIHQGQGSDSTVTTAREYGKCWIKEPCWLIHAAYALFHSAYIEASIKLFK